MIEKGNTAVVVGGSRGLGYAIVQQLLEKDYQKIIVLDKVRIELQNTKIQYIPFDLAANDFGVLGQCDNVNTLIITAGIGRLASFDTFSDVEIQKTFQVNAVSILRIIRYFYKKIKSDTSFYTAIVSSITGAVSSPLFSLYAATKSALYRLIESLNIELEKEGSPNRILNVCPGSLQGTSFYGGESNIELLQTLADTILMLAKNRETLYIPQYDEIYHNVINRYLDNSHQFGLESYDYKINSGRINPNPSITVGYLSGTFDLFHIGHLNILRRAKEHCDYLVVGVHRDASHKRKDAFIPFDERCEILKSVKYVDKVIEAKSEDIDAYEDVKYQFLFVGSDYKGTARFERYEKYFENKEVEIIYFPYTQTTNSTKLRTVLDHSLNTNTALPIN